MPKYYSNIDLNQNEIQNVVIHVVASDGDLSNLPVEGQIIYDESDSLVKYYDGNNWVVSNDLAIVINADGSTTSTLRNGDPLTFVGGTNLTSSVDSSNNVTFSLDDSITLSTVNATTVNASQVTTTDIDSLTAEFGTATITTGNIDTVNSHQVTTTDIDSLTASFGTATITTGNITTGNIDTVNAHQITTTDIDSLTAGFETATITTGNITTGNIDTVNAYQVTTTDIDSLTADFGTANIGTGNINTVNAYQVTTTDIDSLTATIGTVDATTGNITTVNSTNINSSNIVATDLEFTTVVGGTGSIGTLLFSSTDVVINSELTVASDIVVGGTISGNLDVSNITGTIFTISDSTPNTENVTIGETLTFNGTSNEIEVGVSESSGEGIITIGIVDNPTLTGDVTVTNNLTVDGDLTVNGTTTTVDSQTITLQDPILLLNRGADAAPTNVNDIGFVGERGSGQDNIALFWDEDTTSFVAAFTTASGSDIDVLPLTGYADFVAANVTVASDLTIGNQITSYGGSAPTTGQILIGDGAGFEKGQITVTSNTGLAISTATANTINISIDIDAAVDGSDITIDGTNDELLISDDGVEKRIPASRLGDLYVSHNATQSLSSADAQLARQNISAVEIVTSTITGSGSTITRYIPHNLGTTSVMVQILDSDGNQVFADVDTNVGTGGQVGNYVSVTGNFENATDYTVLVAGTRGSDIIDVTAVNSLP